MFLNRAKQIVSIVMTMFNFIRLWKESMQIVVSQTSPYLKTHPPQKIYRLQLTKECTFKFHGSGRLTAKLDGVVERKKRLGQMRVSILRGVNVLLAAIDQVVGVAGLYVDYSSNSCFMQLNRIFKQWRA